MKAAIPIAAVLAASATVALGLSTPGAARADSCPCRVHHRHHLTRAYYTPSWTPRRRVRLVRDYAGAYGPPAYEAGPVYEAAPVYAEGPVYEEGPAYAPAWAQDAVAYVPDVGPEPGPVYGPAVRVRHHAPACRRPRHHDDDR